MSYVDEEVTTRCIAAIGIAGMKLSRCEVETKSGSSSTLGVVRLLSENGTQDCVR